MTGIQIWPCCGLMALLTLVCVPAEELDAQHNGLRMQIVDWLDQKEPGHGLANAVRAYCLAVQLSEEQPQRALEMLEQALVDDPLGQKIGGLTSKNMPLRLRAELVEKTDGRQPALMAWYAIAGMDGMEPGIAQQVIRLRLNDETSLREILKIGRSGNAYVASAAYSKWAEKARLVLPSLESFDGAEELPDLGGGELVHLLRSAAVDDDYLVHSELVRSLLLVDSSSPAVLALRQVQDGPQAVGVSWRRFLSLNQMKKREGYRQKVLLFAMMAAIVEDDLEAKTWIRGSFLEHMRNSGKVQSEEVSRLSICLHAIGQPQISERGDPADLLAKVKMAVDAVDEALGK